MATKPTPWYKYPYTADYGSSPDPEGNYAKPDLNLQCPDGTPITNLLPGTVSGINGPSGDIPAFGAVVTIRLDKPVNAVATHIAYLHLEPLPAYITIGLPVPVGMVVGYSGGASSQGSFKHAPVGVALYNGDMYGYGTTWGLYVGSAWLDPTSVLKAAGNSGTPGQSAADTITSIASHIRPDESVAELLAGMDVALQILNPFTAPSSSLTGDISLFGLAIPVQLPPQVTDPFQYIGDVAEGLIQNFTAVFIRTLFVVIGVVMIVVILQATFTQAVNKALEPVGGISGAVSKVAALA